MAILTHRWRATGYLFWKLIQIILRQIMCLKSEFAQSKQSFHGKSWFYSILCELHVFHSTLHFVPTSILSSQSQFTDIESAFIHNKMISSSITSIPYSTNHSIQDTKWIYFFHIICNEHNSKLIVGSPYIYCIWDEMVNKVIIFLYSFIQLALLHFV